jgi:hypothetical protein
MNTSRLSELWCGKEKYHLNVLPVFNPTHSDLDQRSLNSKNDKLSDNEDIQSETDSTMERLEIYRKCYHIWLLI